MEVALIIGAMVVFMLAVPAVLWLTKLIRPPTPEEDAIHRGVAAARRDARRRMDGLPR